MAYRELLRKLMQLHSINSEFVVVSAEGCVLPLRKSVFIHFAKKIVEKISY